MVACAPYRARTKGKDERGAGYVKRNAVAGRSFESFAAFEAHLDRWTREIVDVSEHGTTGEAPILRFARDEAARLKVLPGHGSFLATRDLVLRVGAECTVEVDGSAYAVPWRLIGERVRVIARGASVRIAHGGSELASHPPSARRRGGLSIPRTSRASPAQGDGPCGASATRRSSASRRSVPRRPLAEYEALVGGTW